MADKRRPADSTEPDERDDDIFAVRVRVTPDQARALVESGGYDTGDHPRFAPDREDAEGQATCEGGEHLPMIGLVGATLARSIQDFVLRDERHDYMIATSGVTRTY